MKILFLTPAHNSFSQRLALLLSSPTHGGHKISVELAISEEVIFEGVRLANPDLVICLDSTQQIPADIYRTYIVLVLHPAPPAGLDSRSFERRLVEDGEEDRGRGRQNSNKSIGRSSVNPTQWWAVTICQAVDDFDSGPTWAFSQFSIPSFPTSTATKSSLCRGPIAQAAFKACLAAVQRVEAAATIAHPQIGFSPLLSPPPESSTVSYPDGDEFRGEELPRRPALKELDRAFDPRTDSAEYISRKIRSADSHPGVLTQCLCGRLLYVYGGILETNPFPPAFHAELPGSIVARRNGAVLMSALDGKGVWITHVRKPRERRGQAFHPKLPATMGLAGIGLDLGGVVEWKPEGFEKVAGTFQEVWIEYEGTPFGKIAYIFFDFYNGVASTRQCHLLKDAILEACRPMSSVRAVVLMGGEQFCNGIALNVIQGSISAASESWENINAMNDVIETLLHPDLPKRGILTVAAIRGNAAFGGVALATCCDVVLCSEGVVLNPHYRSIGLSGSDYHTFSFYRRVGEDVAKRLLRAMLPMSPEQAAAVGLVDLVIGEKNLEREVRSYTEGLLQARAVDGARFRSAPWTRSEVAETFTGEAKPSLVDMWLGVKVQTLENLPVTLSSLREAEMAEVTLDLFHPYRSQRYHTRLRDFVGKIPPKSTPLRFALHRRHKDWSEVLLDEEERDDFDSLGDRRKPLTPEEEAGGFVLQDALKLLEFEQGSMAAGSRPGPRIRPHPAATCLSQAATGSTTGCRFPPSPPKTPSPLKTSPAGSVSSYYKGIPIRELFATPGEIHEELQEMLFSQPSESLASIPGFVVEYQKINELRCNPSPPEYSPKQQQQAGDGNSTLKGRLRRIASFLGPQIPRH